MARRDWGRLRARYLSSQAQRAEHDDAAYDRDLERAYYGHDKPRRALKRGPATLRCTCGHAGRVNTATNTKFRCIKCGKLWSL